MSQPLRIAVEPGTSFPANMEETADGFRFYSPEHDGGGPAGDCWSISWHSAWQPGAYADRDACLAARVYILDVEPLPGTPYLDDIAKAASAAGRLVTAADFKAIAP